jgi:TatA/E family protein of Tat protein translocase
MGGDLLLVLIVILVIVFIWRGPKTLPKLSGSLGRGIREFRQEIQSDDEKPPATTEAPEPPQPPDAPRS